LNVSKKLYLGVETSAWHSSILKQIKQASHVT